MTASVIIATYNRAPLLDECLEALARQHFSPGDEVIVVDNGSSDATPEVIARHQKVYPVPLRHLHEDRPGKSRALVRALEAAVGDIFAFTDDDVNVDASWLDEVKGAMADDEVALVGGPVSPRWDRHAPRWLRLTTRQDLGEAEFRPGVADDGYGRLAAPLALLHYGSKPAPLGSRTLLGANLAIRREVIREVGGFATHLGKLRGTLLSGEDHDLCRRVQAAGYKAIYQPTAVVRHWVPATRMRVRYFLNWFFWSGITNAALDETAARSSQAILGLPYLIRQFVAGAIGALSSAARGRMDVAVEHLIDCAFVTGYAAKRSGVVALEAQPISAAGGVA